MEEKGTEDVAEVLASGGRKELPILAARRLACRCSDFKIPVQAPSNDLMPQGTNLRPVSPSSLSCPCSACPLWC